MKKKSSEERNTLLVIKICSKDIAMKQYDVGIGRVKQVSQSREPEIYDYCFHLLNNNFT